MILLALTTTPRVVVKKNLDHLRLPSTPPPLAPARQATEPLVCGDEQELEQTNPFDAPESDASELTGGAVAPRASP